MIPCLKPLPLARLVLVLWTACGCGGCAIWRAAKGTSKNSPTSAVSLPPSGPQANETGFVETPATVTRTTQTITRPIARDPSAIAGADVADQPRAASARTGAPRGEGPAVETITTTTETATAAKNYAPPAPPTPAQLAEGAGVKLFYWLAAGAAVLAVILAYPLEHYKAAAIMGGVAFAIPMLLKFATQAAASHTLIGGLCLALGLVAGYELLEKRGALVTAKPSAPA